MQRITIQQIVGNTDIYLLDQVIKGQYNASDIVLDAGCGAGRNLHWFIYNQVDCYGIDPDAMAIDQLKMQYPGLPANRFQTGVIEKMPYGNDYFNHVICSAVLHFAESREHFIAMFSGLARVLKPGGSLFIRMTSDIGMEDKVIDYGNGVYGIPDGSTRFLLTKSILQQVIERFRLILIEPVKTVNVEDVRCMTTLVFRK